MIAVLRCVDGRIIIKEDAAGRTFLMAEDYTRPMVGHDPGYESSFYGVDLGVRYARPFKRVEVVRGVPRGDQWEGEPIAALYFEAEQPDMPPEIRSRRYQEVEAEWLRLGQLMDQLK